VRLADGKARTTQHMTMTTFWHTDGMLMSVQRFMETLLGELPEFFKDEAELRCPLERAGHPREAAERTRGEGLRRGQLAEMQKIIDAEKSDLSTCWPTSRTRSRR
jgi:type I restriction enzyme, R subunit